MTPTLRRRLREAVPSGILAITIYLPLLLTKPGYVGADTKTYLYLDPSKMLARASSMWDPNIGMGTVTHQNIGYLWPIGPWYWAFQNAGVPDWVAQRLWLGSILFLAGLGVRFLLKTLGQEGPHVTAATFCYALTPYVLTLAARLSVILLPYAGLPWLIGLTVLALRKGGWRYPALFALVVATIGSVNATSLLLVGIGPVLWIASEVVITREVRFRDAMKVVGRIGALTIGCSLWWLAGLWAQGSYGIEILRYTETAETVATASLSLEVLRGIGYWFFYGEDRYGPWIAPSQTYTTRLPVLLLTYVLPGLGLLGAAFTRFRDRAFFLLLLVVGLFLAVGAHPWDSPPPSGAAIKAFLQSDVGLSMRSLPRAAPLVVLSLSIFVGALIAAVTKDRQRWARPATAGVMVLAVLALPPLWRGQIVDSNLDRKEDIPSYWYDAAHALDRRDDGTRVLEVPGADFASYRWGTTVDPITPGIMNRPYVARELIPYGSPPSADLLDALDHRLQEQTFDARALAPIARFMGVGDIAVRSDITYERYNTPRPRQLWDLLSHAPDIATPLGFGGTARNTPRRDLPLNDEAALLTPPSLPDPPQVGILPVQGKEKIVRTASADRPVILDGDGDGLVDVASAGLLTGRELIMYAGTLATDAHPAKATKAQLDRNAVLVVTDTNRRQARRWGTVRDTTGITERAGQKSLVTDPKDQRLTLFGKVDDQPAAISGAGAGDDAATVTESRGGVWAEATSYGNSVSLTPEDNPVNAVDGNTTTAWRTGGFDSADGETLKLHYRTSVTTDHLRVLQALGGVRNRFITGVDVSLDGGKPHHFELDKESRNAATGDTTPGQTLHFPKASFKTVEITITNTKPDHLRRYDGISAVGLAEVVATDADGSTPVADDVVRLPTDLLDQVGTAANDHALAVVLTRQRVAGTVAVRTDPEPSMARTFTLPAGRSFSLSGEVRLSNSATDPVLDQALGLPDASGGGVTASSKRRLPGGIDNRASNAIDGDPDTWYSPGFLDQHGEYVDYVVPKPTTFDHFSITLLNDGRHSVPRALDLEVDGKLVQKIELPAIRDQKPENARHTVDVKLDHPVAGTHVRLSVDPAIPSVRDVNTLDWFTGTPVVMPIGIVDIAIPGIHVSAPPKRIDPSCRTDLVEVDGKPVGVSLHGTTADLLADKAVSLASCDGAALRLPTGKVTLRTTRGSTTGFDLDRLVLRSAAGGTADPSMKPLVPERTTKASPKLHITGSTRTSTDLTVSGAKQPFWLVLGQSHNLGWHATADGKDLGPPTLVDGYANGWMVPAGSHIDVHLEWTPQRVVWGMIVASVAAVLLALFLIAWPRRSAAAGEDLTWVPLDARPAMPHALDLHRVVRYVGPTPSRFALVGTVAAATAFGFAVIGPIPGLVLGGAAVLALRIPRSRPLLTLGGPLLFAGSVFYIAVHQHLQHLPSGFDWPTYFEGVQQPAWTAVALLLLDAVVDRCWLRRWWPSDSSPS
ncbi:MAG: coagulation factor 5/8 type domain protein [Acidimicrobiales bacterium]|nr:coagulation factor 5/8 type domain protein [Acidimicrobiales bacterium]